MSPVKVIFIFITNRVLPKESLHLKINLVSKVTLVCDTWPPAAVGLWSLSMICGTCIGHKSSMGEESECCQHLLHFKQTQVTDYTFSDLSHPD